MSGPLKPEEIGAAKKAAFPAAVFDAFNAEIAANFSGGSARVKQDDVVARLVEGGMDRAEVFAKGYLNVEETYRDEGWKVEYDKPGYNESYGAFFIFRRKS